MSRVLLTVAMLLQVATCSFSCALAAPRGESSDVVRKCNCCPSQQPSRESIPSDQRDDGDCGICFCNSAANPTMHCDLSFVLDSQAVWTAVEPDVSKLDAPDSTNVAANWHAGYGSGVSLRLAVQSLLL